MNKLIFGNICPDFFGLDVRPTCFTAPVKLEADTRHYQFGLFNHDIGNDVGYEIGDDIGDNIVTTGKTITVMFGLPVSLLLLN